MKIFYVAIVCVLFGIGCNTDFETVENITVKSGNVCYRMKGLDKPFKVMFLSDTHFTVEDERGKEFYSYTKRMGGAAVEPVNYGISNGREKALLASLKKAREEQVELVVLGGDILNFPSLASVETLERIMKESGLKWAYIAGNHDWHYEGENGVAADLRDKWEQRNLKPLYQGNHPLFHSEILHGINFVLIDNSTHEITEDQLDFFKKQINKGLPVVLMMHIPLYSNGHNIDYGCGHPDWNEAHDIYYKIERRNPWPKNGHTKTTFDFCKLVWNSPCIIGVYAGHTHEEAVDFCKGKLQYVSGANNNNEEVLIHFMPASE